MADAKVQRVTDEARWYALRVFKGRIFRVKARIEEKGQKTYMAMRMVDRIEDGHLHYDEVQIVPSLLFVKCPLNWLKGFKEENPEDFMVYRDRGEQDPTPIRDEEMELFMYITSTDHGRDVSYYGPALPAEGERVRVTDGIYKGATGVVKRIKRDRKLLIAVEGVAVVAISHIPISYLEKI